MRAIGSMGHTVMVSNLLPSCLCLIQMSTLNRLELQFASVLSVPSVCFKSVCMSTDLTCDLTCLYPRCSARGTRRHRCSGAGACGSYIVRKLCHSSRLRAILYEPIFAFLYSLGACG